SAVTAAASRLQLAACPRGACSALASFFPLDGRSFRFRARDGDDKERAGPRRRRRSKHETPPRLSRTLSRRGGSPTSPIARSSYGVTARSPIGESSRRLRPRRTCFGARGGWSEPEDEGGGEVGVEALDVGGGPAVVGGGEGQLHREPALHVEDGGAFAQHAEVREVVEARLDVDGVEEGDPFGGLPACRQVVRPAKVALAPTRVDRVVVVQAFQLQHGGAAERQLPVLREDEFESRPEAEESAELQAAKFVVFVLEEGLAGKKPGKGAAVAQVLEDVVGEGLALLDAPAASSGEEDAMRTGQVEDVEHSRDLGLVGIPRGPEQAAADLDGQALLGLARGGRLHVDDARFGGEREEQGKAGD